MEGRTPIRVGTELMKWERSEVEAAYRQQPGVPCKGIHQITKWISLCWGGEEGRDRRLEVWTEAHGRVLKRELLKKKKMRKVEKV